MRTNNQTTIPRAREFANCHTRVPPALWAAVRKTGIDLGISAQDIVIEALNLWLKSVRKAA